MVSVHDAASHSLAWIGSALGTRQYTLGVDRFGESGTIADLHELTGIDTGSIVNAALIAISEVDLHRPRTDPTHGTLGPGTRRIRLHALREDSQVSAHLDASERDTGQTEIGQAQAPEPAASASPSCSAPAPAPSSAAGWPG